MTVILTAHEHMEQIIAYAREHFGDEDIAYETINELLCHDGTAHIARSPGMLDLLEIHRSCRNWKGFVGILRDFKLD